MTDQNGSLRMEWMKPADIERRSMELIEAGLMDRGIKLPEDPLEAAVIRRVIHTTADFDYAANLVFTEGAAGLAVKAFRRGADIVTDTNMAKAGVSRPALKRLGTGEVRCFMADEAVAAAAKAQGITRAAAAVDYAVRLYPDAVYASGNAPTALLRLADRITEGARPSLVVGVPVGFVNVVESKERILSVCRACGVPAILAMGQKGGSTVAAAVLNALLYEAAGMSDPGRR